jgi:Golgi-resident PAP phosphatase
LAQLKFFFLQVVAISKLIDQHVQSKGKTKEGKTDPVTIADKKSHCIMKQGLNRIFPKVKIVSEEDRGADCMDTKFFDLDPTVLHENLQVPDQNVNVDDVTFWIDPLDATQEYTEKLFQYVTTMVCVAVKGKPVIGVIHNPFTLKTVWAWQGQAMSEDLAKIKKVSEPFV